MFLSSESPERKLFKFIGLGIALLSIATLITISVDLAAFRCTAAVRVCGRKPSLALFRPSRELYPGGSALLLSLLLATDFLSTLVLCSP